MDYNVNPELTAEFALPYIFAVRLNVSVSADSAVAIHHTFPIRLRYHESIQYKDTPCSLNNHNLSVTDISNALISAKCRDVHFSISDSMISVPIFQPIIFLEFPSSGDSIEGFPFDTRLAYTPSSSIVSPNREEHRDKTNVFDHVC